MGRWAAGWRACGATSAAPRPRRASRSRVRARRAGWRLVSALARHLIPAPARARLLPPAAHAAFRENMAQPATPWRHPAVSACLGALLDACAGGGDVMVFFAVYV